MGDLTASLVLDIDQLGKLAGYYLYRSEELAGDRPIVDGLYLQKSEIGDRPPMRMRLQLNWEE